MNTLKITIAACSLLFAISTIAFTNRTANSNMVNAQGIAKASNQSAQELATADQNPKDEEKMQFGNFSVSLAVKDIKASKAFYEKLDFKQVGGDLKHNYLIMQNKTATIGLFQGMFEKNILTFNPGWNRNSETLEKFQDVRDLQEAIKKRGITPVTEADPKTKGVASFVIVDPDGNSILVDQHVPKPE